MDTQRKQNGHTAMKPRFHIMITAATAAFVLTANAAPPFHTHRLEVLSKDIGIQLPDSMGLNVDNDSTWTFAGKQLRIRTNGYGDIAHIGYKLFDSKWADEYEARPLLDFLEQYALQSDVPSETNREEKEKPLKITFTDGDESMLRRRTPDMPITVNEKEGRGYHVEWADGNRKVGILVPADYQLLAGANAIELENIFERDVCRIPFTLLADTVPAEWKGSRQSRSDSLIIVGNGSYLSDMIRSDIYLHETAEGVRILLDKSKPLQCVNNILLTGCFDKKIPLSLSIDKYGYTKSEIEVSLQQYILYCRRENCRLYLGIKSVTDEAVTATLFAVNKKMAYNHTLSVEFPLSILHSGEGRMKGTLYAYTPLQNITEEFFINNINQNEQ